MKGGYRESLISKGVTFYLFCWEQRRLPFLFKCIPASGPKPPLKPPRPSDIDMMSSNATSGTPSNRHARPARSLISWKPESPADQRTAALLRIIFRMGTTGAAEIEFQRLDDQLIAPRRPQGKTMRRSANATFPICRRLRKTNPDPSPALDNKTNSERSVLEIRNAVDQQTSRCQSLPIRLLAALRERPTSRLFWNGKSCGPTNPQRLVPPFITQLSLFRTSDNTLLPERSGKNRPRTIPSESRWPASTCETPTNHILSSVCDPIMLPHDSISLPHKDLSIPKSSLIPPLKCTGSKKRKKLGPSPSATFSFRAAL